VNGTNGHARKERPVDPVTGEKAEPSVKERQEALRLKRLARAAELWSEKLSTLKLKFTGLLDALLVFFGTEERRQVRGKIDWTNYRKKKVELNKDAWAQLCPIFQRRLDRGGSIEQQAADIWAEALAQANALGLKGVLEFCWKDAVIECPLTKVLQEAGAKDQTDMPEGS